jgi:1,6-anhydro-N-acetylmuramate kinase
MMAALAARLAPCEVLTMSSLGVDPRQKEALAFAIMDKIKTVALIV